MHQTCAELNCYIRNMWYIIIIQFLLCNVHTILEKNNTELWLNEMDQLIFNQMISIYSVWHVHIGVI